MLSPGAYLGTLALGLGLVPSHELEHDLSRYLEALAELRAGDDAAGAPLAELADHLCLEHSRCDAADVWRFYAAMGPDARAQGLADEGRFLALRARLVEARAQPPTSAPWYELRAELLDDLYGLVEDVEPRADFTPAARAHALIARLELDEAEKCADPARAEEALHRAEEAARASIELFERAGQRTPSLEPTWILGHAARQREAHALACEIFERCFALAGEVQRDEYRERALLGLLDIARDAGDVWQAERLVERLAEFRDPATCWPLAREHARLLLHADRAEVALEFLLRHPPPEASSEGEWRVMLAAAHLRAGDTAAARVQIERTDAVGGELGRLARAALALAEEQPAEVVALLDPADGLGYPHASATWSALARAEGSVLLAEARLALGRPSIARPLLAEALALADHWQGARGESRTGSVIGEWLGVHALVLYATACALDGDALEAARAVEDFQSRRLRSGARVRASDVTAHAAARAGGLVTWAIGADSAVVAHVSAAGDAWAAPVPRGRRAFQSAVRRLREAAIEGSSDEVERLAARLSEELFPEELLARLEPLERGAALLVLVHGPLEGLPLSLLELGGEPLEERFTIHALPGLPAEAPGALPPGARRPWAQPWVLLGAPLGVEPPVPLLPGAVLELDALARLYTDASLASGAAFGREVAISALTGERPVHIATHLVRDEVCDGARLAPVGLLLSGGELLCAGEIARLGPRLPLVVLAACESAGGPFLDGEGLHGLARAFLESGTRNLLVTAWPVDDEAARRFAVLFHEALATGEGPARATASARRALRRFGSPPADWAAFQMLGSD